MLDASLRTQLQGYLQNIRQPVHIVASLDAGAGSRELQQLLSELTTLSNAITVETRRDDAELKPSFSIGPAGAAPRVRFAGIPLGHEFSSLVLALLQAGGHPPRVTAALLEAARAAAGAAPGEELHFESFISLSCQNCPEVVQALNLLALVNPRVRHTMIDGALFEQQVAARQIMTVPAVFLNGQPFGRGRMTLGGILERLDGAVAERAAQQLGAREPYDMLVVGGGPAGAAAAIYAARKGIRTAIVADRFGGQLLDTMGIENFVSVTATEGPRLAADLEAHVRSYGVEIIESQSAVALVPGERIELRLASGASLSSRAVVLATGARWREMNVPGEREYRGRGVAYCPHCDGPLFKGKRVAVIGGGNSGVEAAIDLAGMTAHVTLLEYDARLRADEVLQRKLRSLANVRVLTSVHTTEVLGSAGRVSALRYQDRNSGVAQQLELDGVFVQIGLVPNTDWLKGSVALTARGEIEVDARGQTSLPGVFAAGDVTTTPFKQIVIASGDGAKAALGAFDHLIRSPVPMTVTQAA
jgi:alkyl hydroperoxide reductase subunit F